MSERARREKQAKLAKLAELKRAREGGGRTYKIEDDAAIYDEVTEEQYRSIVRGRLAKDDFVVDDGIGGYMDNGMDDFEEQEQYESDEEDQKATKSKKSMKAEAQPKSKAKVKPPPPVQPSISAYRPTVSAEQETDFMASLLGDMDTIASSSKPSTRPRKRKPERDDDRSSSPASGSGSLLRPPQKTYRTTYSEYDTSSDGPLDTGMPSGPSSDDEAFMSPKKKLKTETPGIAPAITRLSQMEVQSDTDASFDDMDMDAFMAISDDDLGDDVEVKAPLKVKKEEQKDLESKKPFKPLNGTKPTEDKKKLDATPTWLSVYDSLSVASGDTLGPLSTTNARTSSNNLSVLEDDGSFRFYWLDYLEHDGKLYFIAKAQDKNSKAWVSCCVTVENIQRNLFVLPRERQLDMDEETGELYETDVVPSLPDVYSDFDQIRKKAGIKSFRAKFVKRKYAFGERDVPRGETEWLKVVYGFDEPQIPNNVSSPNFSRVFGTNTSAFELLVLKRKIMGPCWLQIKKPLVDNKGVSWCKLEVTVSDPKDINPFSDSDSNAPKDCPPLTVASLSVRTIVNHQENNREIVCATARIWHNIQIDDLTPPEQLPCSVHTFVRPLDRFPPNFENRARANGKGFISPMKNERMLLNSLLATLHKADPDVLVGHEFLGVSLDVLLHRMRDLKADHWSRVGRFRRSKWPSIGRQGSNLKFLNGRLLCDLASDSAKGMISSTTWSLTEMCKTHLKMDRQEIDPDDTASYFDGSVSNPERLLTFVRHCELDAHYQMALAHKVQILPLTRQLTNLAGNSWNKTLNGGRAERNEYILLHEFHRLKYICPDKTWGKKAEIALKNENQDDEEAGKTKSKKDKYKGGLVFEPKRGLWDKFILVMDFNSLYPSIIQEYNIDFTTVEPVEDDENGEEKIPDVPDSSVGQGVLPRLIATLVNRRRQVKSLMKDRKATAAQLLQWDIKQMALKLTANSMYGCLGFEYSRFYARPLAALTTFKGREILTNTRELAESLTLDVVYGDTDSVFVNSNVTELEDALKISAAFKKAVNDRYKLMEIDLDGIFARLLLLQKKKYAAVKVEEGGRTSIEVKGLDMKRREYCNLSKNVSQFVLDRILSGEATEVVVEQIHEYLTSMGEDIRAGKVKLDDFIIFKRLGKNPEDYPDAKSQPHVQVALRMKARGGSARSGDVIPYIFCADENSDASKAAQAERAKHPDEVRRAGSELKIDYEYYIAHQILPPIERLCEPIEGTDRARLAECLGLDPNRYRSVAAGESEERYFAGLDSLLPESERYREAEPFLVRCRSCQGEVAFAPIGDRDSSLLLPSGPTCPACQSLLSTASLQVQLETQIRNFIGKYYEHWSTCDDPTCGNRTRSMGVYGRRCLRQGCRGTVKFEYSDAQLYNQLKYFSYLFNAETAKKAAAGPRRLDEVKALVDVQAEFLVVMTDTVERYLDQCGRRWVELGQLFSFMKI
ncbi:DNA polymerase alpha catalytic subunit [Panus rudis PR-1116 ss-1]|nr:DNA polymerase alpha catalytic subunit [Panus rudis PR-1116 ss-1]